MIPTIVPVLVIALGVLYATIPTHWYRTPSIVTLTTASTSPSTALNMARICHLHHRLSLAHPSQEPKPLLAYLGLHISDAPFNTADWLTPGEAAYQRAQDVIIKAWSERMARLSDAKRQHREQEALVTDVTSALLDAGVMALYMSFVVPELVKTAGDQRVVALMKMCGEEWRALGSDGGEA